LHAQQQQQQQQQHSAELTPRSLARENAQLRANLFEVEQQLLAQRQAASHSQAVADAFRKQASELQQALAEVQAGSSIQESLLHKASQQCSSLHARVAAQRQSVQAATTELKMLRAALQVQPGESGLAALARLKSQNTYNKGQRQQLRQQLKAMQQKNQQMEDSLLSSFQAVQKEFGAVWQQQLRGAISVFEQRVAAADQLTAAKEELQQELAAATQRAASMRAEYKALQQALQRQAIQQQQQLGWPATFTHEWHSVCCTADCYGQVIRWW
jgi:hypothetical protein